MEINGEEDERPSQDQWDLKPSTDDFSLSILVFEFVWSQQDGLAGSKSDFRPEFLRILIIANQKNQR
jgi:hypothetical protein